MQKAYDRHNGAYDRNQGPRYWAPSNTEAWEKLKEQFNGVYRLKKVCELTGLSKTTIYAKVAEGEFPRFVKIGSITAWKAADVQAWLEELDYAA